MAPTEVTEDYYLVLEVDQGATPEVIVASYRRLALKRHPDRSTKHNATAEFQLSQLQQAYETLSDPSRRRTYDLTYASIRHAQTPGPHSAPNTKSDPPSEASQINVLQRLKHERNQRWQVRKKTFESTICQLQSIIRRLEHEIKNLDSIAAAEAATEASKNSWATWLLSPLYKKIEESEEEISRKDRARQERRIEKDMKERRRDSKRIELTKERSLLAAAQKEVDDADMWDDQKIEALWSMVLVRKAAEMAEKQRAERERMDKVRQQEREHWQKVARERAEERKRQEEQTRGRQQRSTQGTQFYASQGSARANNSSVRCEHDGWWSKVHGRRICPDCGDSWTYLLECPGCRKHACPKCQAAIRRSRNARRYGHRARNRSPDYDSFY
ncbi:hypothetical protein PRZ48_002522 [Zasmidium cellare]|uniref:J domain-containing protein n=1 Tax=Zasmidium cellare TaxID=395010 RepID=A0ABR0F6Q4_ZASCE|nr:hypothetical protein PRZ48_002522 [Zasmidium cellare]